MKRIGLISAVAILLIADAVLLFGVAANRSGTPDAVLRLTEKEVFQPPRSEDNSAVVLSVRTQDKFGRAWAQALGCPADRQRPVSKPLFAVAEVWPQVGLGVVDGGTDRAQLRSRYPDRKRYAIANGVLRCARPSIFILPATLYVPPEYLDVIRNPSFEISVCYGGRGEPWICGARRLP